MNEEIGEEKKRKKYCYLLQSGQATTSHHFRCLQQLQTNTALFCICYHSSQTTAERKIKRVDGSVQKRSFLNKKATTNLQLRRNTMQVVFYIHTKCKRRGWRTKDKIYSRYEFVLHGYSGHWLAVHRSPTKPVLLLLAICGGLK